MKRLTFTDEEIKVIGLSLEAYLARQKMLLKATSKSLDEEILNIANNISISSNILNTIKLKDNQ
jgi:hypothetical protein